MKAYPLVLHLMRTDNELLYCWHLPEDSVQILDVLNVR